MLLNERSKIKTAIEKEIWSVYNSNTSILSGICRQLAFAEGGVCWFFKSPTGQLSAEVIFILKFLILFFAFDALQYFFAAAIYWLVAKYYECCKIGSIKNLKKLVESLG